MMGQQVDSGAANRDAYRARMEAQCCQIERYRLQVMREEGRNLSPNEAALEWIARYAEEFARTHTVY